MRIALLNGAMRHQPVGSKHAIGSVEPVAVWDFSSGEFPQGFLHSRDTAAVGIEADGSFTTIGRNMLRYDRSNASINVILEDSSTNILSYSEAVTGSGWIPSGATVSNLALNALGQFAGCRVASNGATWHRLLHAERPQLSNGVPYRVTCWLQLGSSEQAVIILRDNVGATESRLQITSLSFAVQAETAGNINDISSIAKGGILEVSFVFKPNFGRELNLGIGPASSVSGEDVVVFGAQITIGTEHSSYIRSLGGAETRASDIVNWAAPNGLFDIRTTTKEGNYIDQASVSVTAGWSPAFPLWASKLAMYPAGTL